MSIDRQNFGNPCKQNIILYSKFILITLAYGLNGTSFTSIPFLFYRSNLSCINNEGNLYQCSLEEACTNSQGYTQISEYPQIYSITMHLDLYCDRKIIEAWILTLANFGKVVAYLILVFIPIKKHIKELFMNICIVAVGIQLCLLGWVQSTEMFMISFFIWYLFFTMFYGLVYSFIAESFPEYISKFGPAIVNMFWPIVMLVYIAYTYRFGTWENTLIHFTGMPLLLIGNVSLLLSYFFPFTNKEINDLNNNLISQNESSELEESICAMIQFQNICELDSGGYSHNNQQINYNTFEIKYSHEHSHRSSNPNLNEYSNENQILLPNRKSSWSTHFEFLSNDRIVKNNFLIWTLGWVSNGVCYVGCYLQLNTLKGNLYFNSFSSTLFEVVASLVATFIVVKYGKNLKSVIVLTYLIIGISFISCIFMNDANSSSPSLSSNPPKQHSVLITILQLFPIIVAKVSYEIMWTVLVTYQKSVIPLQYHQSQFSCSNLAAVICSNMIPFYKYFIELLGFSPFIGFGVICLLASYYSRQFQEVSIEQKTTQNQQLNFTKSQSNAKNRFVELQEIKSS